MVARDSPSATPSDVNRDGRVDDAWVKDRAKLHKTPEQLTEEELLLAIGYRDDLKPELERRNAAEKAAAEAEHKRAMVELKSQLKKSREDLFAGIDHLIRHREKMRYRSDILPLVIPDGVRAACAEKGATVIYMAIWQEGWAYVGKTKQPFKRRKNQHLSMAKKGEGLPGFVLAVKELGEPAFFEPVARCPDASYLDWWESKVIELFDTVYPNGLNVRW